VRTLRIGITGPIGCGKSTVAAMLAEHGAVTIDADQAARAAYEEPAVRQAVVARFGEGVRRADDSVDRAALARIVFEDPAALRDLERIVHPAVRPRILAGIDAAEGRGAAAVVVEAIKLVEGGLAELFDEVWLVTCDPPVQRGRLRERGVGAADADRRIAAQRHLRDRAEPVATRRIDTSGSLGDTRQQVDEAWRVAQLRREASRPR
jgi:dephospho-CoA kinase